jgi:5-methylcytosine-specific restriction endonuclease McrA
MPVSPPSTRSTTVRDRDRAAIRRTKPPCGICLEPIDYTLKWPDLWCYVVDHVIPIDSGRTPEDRAALDVLTNKQAAHHKCNREKWHRLPEQLRPRTFETWRVW